VLHTRSHLVLRIKCASFWCVIGPSFLWRPFRLLTRFLSFTGKLCYLRQPSFVLRAIGLEITKYRFECQIKSTMVMLFFASCPEPLATELGSWIPTASAVRYYTEMQSCLMAAVFPSILSAISLCLLLRLWAVEVSKNRYSTLTVLVIYLRSLRSINQHRRLSVEQFGCSLVLFLLVQWSSGAIVHQLQCFGLHCLFCCSLAVGCEPFVLTSQYR